jgi:hypothetical protein
MLARGKYSFFCGVREGVCGLSGFWTKIQTEEATTFFYLPVRQKFIIIYTPCMWPLLLVWNMSGSGFGFSDLVRLLKRFFI